MYSLSIFRSDEPFRYYRYRSSSPAAPPVVVSCSVPCRSNPMPFASLVSQFASHPPPHRFYVSSRLVRLFLRLLSSAFSPVPMPSEEDKIAAGNMRIVSSHYLILRMRTIGLDILILETRAIVFCDCVCRSIRGIWRHRRSLRRSDFPVRCTLSYVFLRNTLYIHLRMRKSV